jgi:hypothetical protein
VIILVASFAVMSGYFTVLIYEYAAEGLDKCAQTAATRLLNLCFQVRFKLYFYSYTKTHIHYSYMIQIF